MKAIEGSVRAGVGRSIYAETYEETYEENPNVPLDFEHSVTTVEGK